MLKRFLLLCLLLPLFAFAQYPDKPSNYVTDEAGVLSNQQQQAVNTKLKAFEDTTSSQVFVYIAPTLGDKVMAEYCQEIFHKWKIGSEKNNGVLIAIFVNDHKFRIHTGYGMEGVLPDALTKRIQDNDMKPSFKENDYYTGINNGIDKIIYYSAHEYTAEAEEDDTWIFWVIAYTLNIILICVAIHTIYKGEKNRNKKPSSKTWLTVLAIVLFLIPCAGFPFLLILTGILGGLKMKKVSTASSWSSTSSYDSSSSSSDSSSDSGFDGGGGGDSGGGGSDSSW